MKQKIVPVILSAPEALRRGLAENLTVLYIEEPLYRQLQGTLHDAAAQHGYVITERSAKHGIFLLRSRGSNPFDPLVHEIYDPLEIL